MIIIINGSLGVGKTSVAEQLHYKFEKSVNLDGDYIGDVNPFEIYDEARVTYLYRTLEHLIRFHQKNGYSNFVINYVFESAESLQELIDLLKPLDTSIHTYWLTCSAKEQAKRIQKRKREEINWELDRFVELQLIQAEASRKGFIGKKVDTSGLSPQEIAAKIWEDILISSNTGGGDNNLSLDFDKNTNTEPAKFKGTSIFFINEKNQVLLFLRDNKNTIPFPNCWDALGGKVEPDETPLDCIIREMEEEICFKLESPDLFNIYDLDDRIEYTFWKKADLKIKEIDLKEGQELKWFTEKEIFELPDNQIAFGFKPIILDFFNKKT